MQSNIGLVFVQSIKIFWTASQELSSYIFFQFALHIENVFRFAWVSFFLFDSWLTSLIVSIEWIMTSFTYWITLFFV